MSAEFHRTPFVTIPAAMLLAVCAPISGCVGCTAIKSNADLRNQEIRVVAEQQRSETLRALVAAGKTQQEIKELLDSPDPERAKKLTESALRLRYDNKFSTTEAAEIMKIIAEKHP